MININICWPLRSQFLYLYCVYSCCYKEWLWPHNAVMQSCEGVFVIHCNCLKLQELLYGENSNMFENVFPILKCLGYFLFDFQI